MAAATNPIPDPRFSPMPSTFNSFGVSFQYPDGWALEVEEEDGGHDITVYGQDGSFWSLTINGGADPLELAQIVVQAMDEQYDELDAEAATDMIAGQELVGFDVNFYCLDLTNTAQIRAFRAGSRTMLLMWQAEDHDFAAEAPIFRAITTSLLGSL